MIDEKSFMEFFEKEYGVKFVDVSTGKNALDIIKEMKSCKTCRHIIYGDGLTLHLEDMVCGNSASDHATDFRFSSDSCNRWESTKEGND
jgi:formylmethanofuran dehydrogenase subunit E